MNFSRVKVLFLSVFLALNIFLALQWWSLQTSVSVYAEPLSDQLAHAQSVLASYHVVLAAGIPVTPSQLSELRVTYDHTGLAGIASVLLSVKISQAERMQRGADHLVAPGFSLTALGNGRFEAIFTPHVPPAHTTGPRLRAADLWRTWLSKHGYNATGYQELSATLHGHHEIVSYAQEVNGYPAFSSRIVMQLLDRKLVSYTQTSLAIEQVENPHPLINAVSALLSLADFLDKSNLSADNTIQDIRLGYASSIESNHEWILAPVWRMQTIRGTFLVNALTGEVSVESP